MFLVLFLAAQSEVIEECNKEFACLLCCNHILYKKTFHFVIIFKDDSFFVLIIKFLLLLIEGRISMPGKFEFPWDIGWKFAWRLISKIFVDMSKYLQFLPFLKIIDCSFALGVNILLFVKPILLINVKYSLKSS